MKKPTFLGKIDEKPKCIVCGENVEDHEPQEWVNCMRDEWDDWDVPDVDLIDGSGEEQMPLLHISPSEMQYGMKFGYVDQGALTGLSGGTDNYIIELLFRHHVQDQAFQQKLAGAAPYYLSLANNAFTNFIAISNYTNRIDFDVRIGGVPNSINVVTHEIFKNTLHIFYIVAFCSV